MNISLQTLKTTIPSNSLTQMPEKEMSNDKFFKKYEAYEKESMEDFIRRYSSTETELRETIAYLIEHRQMMRDVEIEKLEAEAANLLKKCLRKLGASRRFARFRKNWYYLLFTKRFLEIATGLCPSQ